MSKNDIMIELLGMADKPTKRQKAKTEMESRLVYNPAALFEKAKALLEKPLGIKLVLDASAATKGYVSIFVKKSPELEGIDVADVKINARPSPEEMVEISAKVRKILLEEEDEELSEFLLPLFSCMENSTIHKDKIAAFAKHQLTLKAEYESSVKPSRTKGFYDGIAISLDNLSPDEDVRAFVPDAHRYPEAIRKLTANDLFPQQSEIEQEALMLIIGRGLYGRPGTIHIGTKSPALFSHTMNSLIYQSRQGGTGKSSFFEMIADGVTSFGYNVTFDPRAFVGEFGHVHAYASDFLFCEDMSKETVEGFTKNDTLKRFCTGEASVLNEKNKAHVTVVPTGVLLSTTNHLDANSTTGMQSAFARRLCIIGTMTRVQLLRLAKELNVESALPVPYIEELASRYGVTKELLVQWYLRLCLDRFIALLKSTENRNTSGYMQKMSAKTEFRIQALDADPFAQAMQFSMLMLSPLHVLREVHEYISNTPKSEYASYVCNDIFRKHNCLPVAQPANKNACRIILSRYAYILGAVQAHDVRSMVWEDYANSEKLEGHLWLAFSMISKACLPAFMNSVTAEISNADEAGKTLNDWVSTRLGCLTYLSSGRKPFVKVTDFISTLEDYCTEKPQMVLHLLELAISIKERLQAPAYAKVLQAIESQKFMPAEPFKYTQDSRYVPKDFSAKLEAHKKACLDSGKIIDYLEVVYE